MSGAKLLHRIASLLLLAASSALACPDGQYEVCAIVCVCVPNSGEVIKTPGKVGGEVVEKIKEDPVKFVVNPGGYINQSGIPTPGDFVEFIVKNPDKLIELVNNPGQWPYIPVAQGIISARNAVINGGGAPIPVHIKSFLQRWYPLDLINSVRWTSNWGPLNNSLQAAQMNFNSSTQAIALINAVVFRNAANSQDPALWAHEMYHINQYRQWGVFGFAQRWVDNSSVNGPVESPAYAREKEARAVLSQTAGGGTFPGGVIGSGTADGGVGNPPMKLPSGYPLSMCGCFGPLPPNANRPAPACASGIDVPRMCPGMCPGGGFPYQSSCM
ncbi:DUF4157 domain-containing protein [Noviherbaspirillum sp. L7-7A]|uniref:eCIS core domain-containing protein n=1 Tax=Noviherbaspirillum sp. L7-7A TaxID=2850560 RepID=UPI001C2CA318|nr:DUF4157 domain-containing protein [Noviherbaspirillum sp. L7-7A]MBV0882140.1 DUF4157 domain-containing protein [Noviherbaspirillum sp. L7-7A]